MAYNFDGSNDYIRYTTDAVANDLANISYAFWVIDDQTVGSNRNIFWKGDQWDNNFHSFIQFDAGLSRLAFVSNWGNQPRWSINRPDSSWHHHVVVYDYTSSGAPTWYVDGVSQSVNTDAAPISTGDYTNEGANLAIGAGHDGSYERWDGKIAEFAIWNRLLSAAEASMLGKGYAPSFIRNGLVFYDDLNTRGSTRDQIKGTSGSITEAAYFEHPPIIYPYEDDSPYYSAVVAPSYDYRKSSFMPFFS